MKIARLVATLALVACGGTNEDSASAAPAPAAQAGNPPVPGPTTSQVHSPVPPPSPFAACTASSAGPCAVLDLIEPIVGLSVHDLAPMEPVGPIATDGASFYWSTSTQLRRAPKAGSPPGVDAASVTVLDTGYVFALAVDASAIYWDSDGGLLRLAKTGATTPTTVVAKGGSNIVLDASDLYFSDGSGVHRVPFAGGSVATVAAAADIKTFALDATNVYYRTASDVMTVPKSGGTPTSLLHAAGETLVLVGSKLYVDNVVGGLVQFAAVPVEGGPPEPIDLGSSHVVALTGYDGALYFVNEGKAIRRVPVDGSAPTEVKVAFFGPPRDLVVDSSGVYWIDHRQSCQLETVRQPQAAGDYGEFTCNEGLFETVVLRLPVVF